MRLNSTALMLVLLSLVSGAAQAVQVNKCPDKFALNISKVSTFNSSSASELKGWVEARDTLEANKGDRTISFQILSRTTKTCLYDSETQASGLLLTIQFNDPEESTDTPIDKLKVEFVFDKSWYSLFLDVSDYNNDGLVLFSKGPKARNAIRARVLNRRGGAIEVEVGRARVDVVQ